MKAVRAIEAQRISNDPVSSSRMMATNDEKDAHPYNPKGLAYGGGPTQHSAEARIIVLATMLVALLELTGFSSFFVMMSAGTQGPTIIVHEWQNLLMRAAIRVGIISGGVLFLRGYRTANIILGASLLAWILSTLFFQIVAYSGTLELQSFVWWMSTAGYLADILARLVLPCVVLWLIVRSS